MLCDYQGSNGNDAVQTGVVTPTSLYDRKLFLYFNAFAYSIPPSIIGGLGFSFKFSLAKQRALHIMIIHEDGADYRQLAPLSSSEFEQLIYSIYEILRESPLKRQACVFFFNC